MYFYRCRYFSLMMMMMMMMILFLQKVFELVSACERT